MSKSVLPSNWNICATCARWGGNRRPADVFCSNVEFDDREKGKCYGGVFNLGEMSATARCDKWEPQYKKR